MYFQMAWTAVKSSRLTWILASVGRTAGSGRRADAARGQSAAAGCGDRRVGVLADWAWRPDRRRQFDSGVARSPSGKWPQTWPMTWPV